MNRIIKVPLALETPDPPWLQQWAEREAKKISDTIDADIKNEYFKKLQNKENT